MKAIVFAGPSLADAVLPSRARIELRPPARQGDLYEAARTRPLAIGLVDGRFETVPSVWHKEILWALSHGIPVYGAASMGALRAAELAAFGMIGVGRIFAAYRSRRIESDDAVAVVHAPAELGYRPLSEALVDMQATLAASVRAGIVSGRTALRLDVLAQKTFFKERTWERVFGLARAAGLPDRQIDALERWIAENKIPQKRRDALALIRRLGRLPPRRAPFRPGFTFQRTAFWRAVADGARG